MEDVNKIRGREKMTSEQHDMEVRFTYHKPKEGQPEKYGILRTEAKRMAYAILEMCPHSRERSLAITRLEECIMWANAAIARNE